MNAADEMRAKASRMVDSDVSAILGIAIKNMAKNRWERLRKRQAIPMDQREHDYMFALNNYVRFKIALHRYNTKAIFHGNKNFLEGEVSRWRSKMDLIECDLIQLSEKVIKKILDFPVSAAAGPYFRSIDERPEGIVLKGKPVKPLSAAPVRSSTLVKRNHDHIDTGD